MSALTMDEASQSLTRTPKKQRQGVHSAWYVVATLLVAFGSGVGATVATRWLLGGNQPTHAPARQTIPPISVMHDGDSPGGGGTLAVGMGATQSYDGMAITVDQLHVVASNSFVGAPDGSHLAIVTVTLMNTDPVQSLPYNAADFWLSNPGGTAQHEVFVASANQLGAGKVAPHDQVVGEVAFLVTATPDPNAPDPEIVFAPSAEPAFSLRWDVPLVSQFP
jgi:hypothetical protein